MSLPVIDIHCDLLSYLQDVPNADPVNDNDAIGCTLNALHNGGVTLQVMAIYTATEQGSAALGYKQSTLFKDLLAQHSKQLVLQKNTPLVTNLSPSSKIEILAAIENASGFCEENDALENGFKALESIIENTGPLFYIGLTHHRENRFGGGNSTKTGLKRDGELLLDYIHNKKIAIDLSHTSDNLAFDILNYTSKQNLSIPVIASHSNFRKVFDHPRNLPDEIAKEIIKRKGLIGINFLRAFINDQNPNALYDHILHGIALGAEDCLCFGADYFYTASHSDQSRSPFFFKEHENASHYPSILENLLEYVSPDIAEKMSYKNVAGFINHLRK